MVTVMKDDRQTLKSTSGLSVELGKASPKECDTAIHAPTPGGLVFKNRSNRNLNDLKVIKTDGGGVVGLPIKTLTF